MSQCIESNQRKVYQKNNSAQTVKLTVLQIVSCLNIFIAEDAKWFEELHVNQFPTDYWSIIVSFNRVTFIFFSRQLFEGRNYLRSCWGPGVERLCSVSVFSIVTYSVFRGEMGAADGGDISANQRPTWVSIDQSEARIVWAALKWRGSALLLWNR